MKKYEDKEIFITNKQMDLIHQLKNKTDKIVAFGFIYMNCLFADDKGEFDCTILTLQHLTNTSDEQVRKVVDILIAKTYIHCVYRNKFKSVDFNKRKYKVNKLANRFQLAELSDTISESNTIYKFKFINTSSDNILYNYYKCYYEYMINNNITLPRRFKEQYSKHCEKQLI